MITSHIFEKLDKGQFSFTDFFGRRIRRIFPALILVMACSLAFGWTVLWSEEFAQLGKHIASGAVFIVNFILVDESGYFDNAAETKPMLHLWSLAVEEQFYIVWPLVLWLAWKRKFNLLTITILVAVVSFYLNLRFVKSHPTETFFWLTGRFWELLSGSVLAWLLLYKSDLLSLFKLCVDKFLARIIHSKEADGTTTSNLMSFFGLLLLAHGVILINESLSFPSKWALIPVLGAILIIASGSKAWLNRIFLMNPIAVWFGLISYPLYLWHWPILSFLQIVEGEIPHINARILAVLFSILLAWLTYIFIERPIRSSVLSVKVWTKLFVMLAFVGSIGLYVMYNDGVPQRGHVVKYEKVNAEFVGPIWNYTKNETCLSKYDIEGSDKWGWFFCSLSKDRSPSIILLGNSYANDFYVGFVGNKDLEHHSVLSIGTCSVEWPNYNKRKAEEDTKKRTLNLPCWGERALVQFEHINKIIKEEKSLKYAILALNGEQSMTAERFERLLRRIRFIRENGLEVILFQSHSNPSKDYDIKSCYARPLAKPRNDCKIDRNKLENHNKAFDDLVRKIKLQVDVYSFNPNVLFCEGKGCSYILDDEMPAFRDQFAHFSKFASERLIDRHFTAWAKQNVPNIFK